MAAPTGRLPRRDITTDRATGDHRMTSVAPRRGTFITYREIQGLPPLAIQIITPLRGEEGTKHSLGSLERGDLVFSCFFVFFVAISCLPRCLPVQLVFKSCGRRPSQRAFEVPDSHDPALVAAQELLVVGGEADRGVIGAWDHRGHEDAVRCGRHRDATGRVGQGIGG